MTKTGFLSIAGVTGLLALAASQAGAYTIVGCPASFTANGTAKVYNGGTSAASSCQYLTPPDNSVVANVANVNAAGDSGEGFFSHNDWQLSPGGANQLSVGASSGSWSVPSVDFANYDYMLTFKDGNGTNLVSFLLNESFSSGSWSTPFTDPPFDLPGESTSKEVSHYTLFRRANTTTVPEPTTLALFSLGLLGVGFAARRRKD